MGCRSCGGGGVGLVFWSVRAVLVVTSHGGGALAMVVVVFCVVNKLCTNVRGVGTLTVMPKRFRICWALRQIRKSL